MMMMMMMMNQLFDTRVLSLLLLLFFLHIVKSLHIRPAVAKDVFAARKILFQEAMNPLAVSERTLVVAEKGDDNDDEHDNDGKTIITTTSTTSSSKRSKTTTTLLGFGQIRPLDAEYSELASLYVMPDHRHQGIGSALVTYLLQQHDAANHHNHNNHPQAICLLTLEPTMELYARHGFKKASPNNLPPAIQFEFKAGSMVSSLLGNDIVCMIRNGKDKSK